MNDETWMPKNLEAPPIKVKHANLASLTDRSRYARKCPVCEEGTLLMCREKDTLVLREDDRCLLCGQTVIYEDIDDVRKHDWANVTHESV